MHSLQLTPSKLHCKDSLFENDYGNQFEDAIKETMGIPYHWEEHITGDIIVSIGNTPFEVPSFEKMDVCFHLPSFASSFNFISSSIFPHSLAHSSRVGVAIETLRRSNRFAANSNQFLFVRAMCLADAKERQMENRIYGFNSCWVTKHCGGQIDLL
jgi:hypothetical protein